MGRQSAGKPPQSSRRRGKEQRGGKSLPVLVAPREPAPDLDCEPCGEREPCERCGDDDEGFAHLCGVGLGGALAGNRRGQFLQRGEFGVSEHHPHIGWNGIALVPRTNCGRQQAGECDDPIMTGLAQNGSMCSHSPIMHFALQERKRLLHNDVSYRFCMSDPAERLRVARLRAGYETGKDAAEAMGQPVSTYLGHENGSRGYPAKKAAIYARKFKVREQWLLYGVGPGPGDSGDQSAEIIHIVEHLPPLRKAEALGYLRALATISE